MAARCNHLIACALLFCCLVYANNEELMISRRNLRVAQLPPAPQPPAVSKPALVYNPIDQFIVAKWKKQAPMVCDDATFLRRAYLDLIGVIPTVHESQSFLTDRTPDKRAKLVDALLARNADYATHWTPFWEEALASSTTASRGGIATHGNYREWIYNNLCLLSRICGLILVPGVAPSCDTGQFP